MIARRLATAVGGALFVIALSWWPLGAQRRTPPVSEAAYRANNLGVARLEQYDVAGAEASFRRALALAPAFSTARLNLGIALFYGGHNGQARAELQRARQTLPDDAHPDYVLGLLARAADRTAEALAAFVRARRLDPADPGIAINIGQIELQARRYPEALAAFRTAIAAEPYNATAVYGFATTLIRSGAPDEGRAAMDRFERLRASPFAVTYSLAYLEQGRYAQAVASTGAEAALVDAVTPAVRFVPATAAMLPAASASGPGSVTLFDADTDGDLDLTDAAGGALRLYRNDGGRFTEVASAALAAVPSGVVGALTGDADADGDPDLIVLGGETVSLFKQIAPWRFADAGPAAGLAVAGLRPRTAAWLDADHDGDLDLAVAGDGTPAVHLLQNTGDGAFSDVTAASRIASSSPVAALIPTDYDERRDIDLFVLSAGGPLLFRNLREGSFEDTAAAAGLVADGDPASAAAGDFNKDGYPDFFIGRRGAPGILASSNGRAGFNVSPLAVDTADAAAAQALDYDSDGLVDLVMLTARGLVVLRNVGGRWVNVSMAAVPAGISAASLASGDLDGDGDVDLVLRGPGGLTMLRNDGPRAIHSLRVRLAANASNRSAVGAKIEVRAGSLLQKREVYAAAPAPAPSDLVFGLGNRIGADVARVLWPSGILQAEAARSTASLTGALVIQELDRKPSSCPYLYIWNGERFEFVTDFLGGGEMGAWVAPGVRGMPDPDEYVRIDGARLRAKNGRYEIRVTNELEEALFLDRLQLVAIAHPPDAAVYPNEGLRASPEPFRLAAVRDVGPPESAIDEHGHDVRDRVAALDRQYVDDFRLEPVRGYAAGHTLTIGLRAQVPDRPRVLLLTGWTDYAFSSDNVAASQRGLTLAPPALQIPDGAGSWRTVMPDMGFPVGRPQTVLVDLSSIPAGVGQVRITTTMRVYWDQVQVGVLDTEAPVRVARIDPATASLRWRGFSAEVSPDGRGPFAADYARVSTVMPWKIMPGRYTREGDVRDLLMRVDDQFVVSRSGDEVAIAFDESAAPPVPAGWTMTFLLSADGFSKEMNLSSGSPDALEPLPFHGMARYPYAASEAPARTGAYRAYLDRFNTRVVARPIPSIDLFGPADAGQAPRRQ